MQAHASDAGVFIRSMATRGHLGGLSRATADAVVVLDAAGRDVIILETVGVGQDEVEVARAADISLLVLVPGSGDDVQALKAGVMEIADIFVVNKADRHGADRMVATIDAVLSLASDTPQAWRPPVLQTVATSGVGIDDLIARDRALRGQCRTRAARPGARKGRGAGTRHSRCPVPAPGRPAGAGAGGDGASGRRGRGARGGPVHGGGPDPGPGDRGGGVRA